MTSKRRVLYIVHNHPRIRPGGAEQTAYDTYLAMRESDDYEPYLLAKAGPPLEQFGRLHEGTLFSPADPTDANQYFVYTDGFTFDHIFGTVVEKELYTKHLDEFLRAINPDIVHIQHTLFLGYDLIRQVRNSLPHAAIIYTLHEYLPICHRDGQMLRTAGNELCSEESPRRCHQCFPQISTQTFFLRKRFVQSHFRLVDLFISPSRFLLERYVEWGIPRERIIYEENGRPLELPIAEDEPRPRRDRLGFFGQLNRYKGADVLLEAMRLLVPAGAAQAQAIASDASTPEPDSRRGPHLWLHGANIELQDGTFLNRFRELVEAVEGSVTVVGRYSRRDLPRLMRDIDWVVVPSIWWENAPLVIQEAFMHGRPVICSDIGGMAEKVADGVTGLHFRAGDPRDLARVIRRAVESPALWTEMHARVPAVHTMKDHVATLENLYEQALTAHAESAAAS